MRGISLDPADITAEARGINELQGRIPVLTRIEVHYTLKIPEGSRETVDRALSLWHAGLNQLTVSLDFPDERHDKYRGWAGLSTASTRPISSSW